MALSRAGSAGIGVGGSIAVNGVCLTAVEVRGSAIVVDVIPETVERTNLGMISPGDKVNLELPMSPEGRFDGHLVQGHIDGVGLVQAVTNEAGEAVMSVKAPESLMRYVVEKGSIAIDGVSLTVAEVTPDTFSVALIPHTLSSTTLGLRKAGEVVNLEVDIVAKYVERLLRARQ